MLSRIVLVCMLGAFLNLDTVSFGQFQFSRPIVSGIILGYFLGDHLNGLILGALLELIWVGFLPVGVYIPPDVPLMGSLAVIWLIMAKSMLGFKSSGLMPIIVILVVPIGYFGNASESWLRRYNIRFIPQAERYIEAGQFDKINRLKWWGVALNYCRLLFLLLLFVLPLYLVFRLWPEALSKWMVILLEGNLARPLKVFSYLIPAIGIAAMMAQFYVKELALYLWGGFVWGFILVSVVQMDVLWYTIYTLGLVLILSPVLYLVVVKKGVEWW